MPSGHQIYGSHVLATKTGTHTSVNWLIRYIMQDGGFKYLHLSIDLKQIFKLDASNAKETKGIN